MAGILVFTLLFLVVLGMPIGFVLGIASFASIIFAGDIPFIVIPQKMFGGINSFPILAIPFFILAGDLMNAGGLNKRLIRVAKAFLGSIHGSLASVTVVASMFFAAISGSAVATVSAIGGITIPAMQEEGYDPDYTAAVSASAAVSGPLIPPSIPLIVYGSALGMSISDLFIASTIPGIMFGLSLLMLSYYIARKRNFPRSEKASVSEKVDSIKDGIGALLMPVIILGGIFSGIFTATEAAVVSVVYALFVGMVIYKTIKIKDLHRIMSTSAISTSVIMIILSTSKLSSWVVVISKLPTIVSNYIGSLTENGIIIMLLINVILLIVGCLMEANAAIIILIPVLLPLAKLAGVSPLQFGVIMTMNLSIGLLTPPVGATLLVGSNIAHAKFEKVVLAVIPFFITGLAILLLVTYVPFLTEWLPSIFK